MTFRIGSLFTGIGGFEVAGDKMGWETVFCCENNPFGKHVLSHLWPTSIIHNDIRKTNFTIYRGLIDVLTGGFPCQPYSAAGKRLGKNDERHLWPEILRAIREIQPTWVIGENVSGIVNWNDRMVFNEVQVDLETEGYEVIPFLLPAAGVNAPHQRERVWFVAYSHGNYIKRSRESGENRHSQTKGEGQENQWERIWNELRRNASAGFTSDSTSNGLQRWSNGRELRETWPVTKQRSENVGSVPAQNWQNFPTQPALCDGNDGLPYESLRQRIREDCMGILSEKEIDTILSKAHEEWRKESIKAGGNAIVPEVALQIFKAIEMFTELVSEHQE